MFSVFILRLFIFRFVSNEQIALGVALSLCLLTLTLSSWGWSPRVDCLFSFELKIFGSYGNFQSHPEHFQGLV